MNYLPPRDMDPPYGPDLSDAADEGLKAHAEIQAHIAALMTALSANMDHMLVENTYESLMAALEDATMKPAQVEDLILQEEADRVIDARAAWADRRYDMRRDEEGV